MLIVLEVPREVRKGTPVPFLLRVTNKSARPSDLITQGRPTAFDIVVAGSDGHVVWRRLEGVVISTVLQVRTLAPGEGFELRDTWSQLSNTGEPVDPGEYSVTGVLPTDPPGELRTPPVPLRIVP